MRSPSRHALPQDPERRPDWRRAGIKVLRGIGWGAYAVTWAFIGAITALSVVSGINGTPRILLALATIGAVAYFGLVVVPVAGMVAARIANMIMQRWRWRRG
jgi:hypothetical protein